MPMRSLLQKTQLTICLMFVSLLPAFSQTTVSTESIVQLQGEKALIITIDDGYNFDSRIVNYIEEKNIPVIALVNGDWAAENGSTIQRLDKAGVKIGLHNHTHVNITELSSDELASQIKKNTRAIMAAGISPAPFYRPPYGITNNRTNKIIADAGYNILLFDTQYSTADFVDSWTIEFKKQRLAENLKTAQGGIIILLHFGHRDSYEMLRFTVEWAEENNIPIHDIASYFSN